MSDFSYTLSSFMNVNTTFAGNQQLLGNFDITEAFTNGLLANPSESLFSGLSTSSGPYTAYNKSLFLTSPAELFKSEQNTQGIYGYSNSLLGSYMENTLSSFDSFTMLNSASATHADNTSQITNKIKPSVKKKAVEQQVIPIAEEVPETYAGQKRGFWGNIWSRIGNFFNGVMNFMSAPFSTIKSWIFGPPNQAEKQSRLSKVTEFAGNTALSLAGTAAIGPYMMIGDAYHVSKQLLAD